MISLEHLSMITDIPDYLSPIEKRHLQTLNKSSGLLFQKIHHLKIECNDEVINRRLYHWLKHHSDDLTNIHVLKLDIHESTIGFLPILCKIQWKNLKEVWINGHSPTDYITPFFKSILHISKLRIDRRLIQYVSEPFQHLTHLSIVGEGLSSNIQSIISSTKLYFILLSDTYPEELDIIFRSILIHKIRIKTIIIYYNSMSRVPDSIKDYSSSPLLNSLKTISLIQDMMEEEHSNINKYFIHPRLKNVKMNNMTQGQLLKIGQCPDLEYLCIYGPKNNVRLNEYIKTSRNTRLKTLICDFKISNIFKNKFPCLETMVITHKLSIQSSSYIFASLPSTIKNISIHSLDITFPLSDLFHFLKTMIRLESFRLTYSLDKREFIMMMGQLRLSRIIFLEVYINFTDIGFIAEFLSDMNHLENLKIFYMGDVKLRVNQETIHEIIHIIQTKNIVLPRLKIFQIFFNQKYNPPNHFSIDYHFPNIKIFQIGQNKWIKKENQDMDIWTFNNYLI